MPRPDGLSLGALLGAGLASLRDRRGLLVIALPVGLVLAGLWTWFDLVPDRRWPGSGIALEIALGLLAMFWQRRLLLGPEPLVRRSPDGPPPSLIGRYLLFGALLALLVAVPALILAVPFVDGDEAEATAVFVAAVLCAAAVMVLLLGRLFLVFPPLAIGRPSSFRAAWRLGRGHGLRLGALVVVVALPALALAAAAMLLLPATLAQGVAGLVGANLAMALVRVLTTLVAAAALAHAWRRLDAEAPVIPPDSPVPPR